MKDSYERTILNITEFQTDDVIMTSGPDIPGPDPVPNAPTDHYQVPIRM